MRLFISNDGLTIEYSRKEWETIEKIYRKNEMFADDYYIFDRTYRVYTYSSSSETLLSRNIDIDYKGLRYRIEIVDDIDERIIVPINENQLSFSTWIFRAVPSCTDDKCTISFPAEFVRVVAPEDPKSILVMFIKVFKYMISSIVNKKVKMKYRVEAEFKFV